MEPVLEPSSLIGTKWMNTHLLFSKKNVLKDFYSKYFRISLIFYVGIYLSLFAIYWTGITKISIIICISLYIIHMWSVTAGLHRYFSHKSFSTSRAFQFILALLGQCTTQNGVLWWADRHRHHHAHSDSEFDIHSPRWHGLFYSHVGWIFDNTKIMYYKDYTRVKDLQRFPELVWLDKYDLLPTFLLAVLIFCFAGWSGFIVGFCLSQALTWDATYTINSLAHRFGSQRYNTGDDSRNNIWLAIITFGEGWHNNHHHYASSARHGFFWWEIDITYYSLKLLERLGIIWNLKLPPPEVINNYK